MWTRNFCEILGNLGMKLLWDCDEDENIEKTNFGTNATISMTEDVFATCQLAPVNFVGFNSRESQSRVHEKAPLLAQMLRWDIIFRVAAESIFTFGRTFAEAWAHVTRSAGSKSSLAFGLTPNKKMTVQVRTFSREQNSTGGFGTVGRRNFVGFEGFGYKYFSWAKFWWAQCLVLECFKGRCVAKEQRIYDKWF